MGGLAKERENMGTRVSHETMNVMETMVNKVIVSFIKWKDRLINYRIQSK